MVLLVIGLALFLGIHSVRIFAPQWRDARLDALGEGKWKGIYSIVSLASFILLVYGYGLAREGAQQVFEPPLWSRLALMAVMPVAFVLWFASQPGMGFIKRTVKHPLLWSVILWSGFHLLANGDLASLVLFVSVLVWAMLDMVSALRRPVSDAPAPTIVPDLISIVVGLLLAWAFFAFLHEWLIGVAII